MKDIVSNVQVYGLEESIKRAKYPMSVDIGKLNSDLTNGIKSLGNAKRGSGHDNFLKGIIVQFDLTFTVKAWTEGERYHWFDIISSQSTMHRITKFDLDKTYIKYVDSRVVSIMKELVSEYNDLQEEIKTYTEEGYIRYTKEAVNKMRELATEKYLNILYTNPCGFTLTAGMTTNYQQLKTIYYQRKTHRLPEWRSVCAWIETLPMFKELCLGGNEDEK